MNSFAPSFPGSDVGSHATGATPQPNFSGQIRPTFTFDLPFNIRRQLCELLDADGSWKQLGGEFMGHNDTQLTLISHALYRGASPTNDLLTKWESKNPKISTLFKYLAQMNHQRAMRILKPFVDEKLQALCLDSQEDEDNFDDLNLLGAVGGLGVTIPRRGSFGTIANRSSIGGMPYTPHSPGMDSFKYTNNNFDSIAREKQRVKMMHSEFGFPGDFNINDLNSDRMRERNPAAAPSSAGAMAAGPDMPDISHRPASSRQQFPPEIRIQDDEGRQSVSVNQSVLSSVDDELKVNYKELLLATDDFANENILGSGGFGVVYKGEWKGTQVAIKRLKNCDLLDQALTELKVLNRYRIDNILPLYGISLDGPEACLLYQYMPNGSLEDRLLCKGGTKPLAWSQRANIGEGVARGLNYLHTLKGRPLVHGDVKSANVLLDANYEPKLGDFGLARQVLGSGFYTHCTVSSVHGTSVYLPPEYLRQKKLSPAVDVYSYGIVMLEMATGRRAYDGKQLLLDWVQDRIQELKRDAGCEAEGVLDSQLLLRLKDRRLPEQTDSINWFENLLKLGQDCAARIKKKRPDMRQVLEYYSQCRTKDRIRRLSADADQLGSIPGLKTPLELQLWYDMVRKAGGDVPESTICPTIGTNTDAENSACDFESTSSNAIEDCDKSNASPRPASHNQGENAKNLKDRRPSIQNRNIDQNNHQKSQGTNDLDPANDQMINPADQSNEDREHTGDHDEPTLNSSSCSNDSGATLIARQNANQDRLEEAVIPLITELGLR